MASGMIKLEILSPERRLFSGDVACVRLPGSVSPFTVLYNHAPLIAHLQKGTVSWETPQGGGNIAIEGGFAEVKDNRVSVCAETAGNVTENSAYNE